MFTYNNNNIAIIFNCDNGLLYFTIYGDIYTSNKYQIYY